MCKGSIIYSKQALKGTISYLIGIESSCRSLISIHIVIVCLFLFNSYCTITLHTSSTIIVTIRLPFAFTVENILPRLYYTVKQYFTAVYATILPSVFYAP